MSLGTDTKTFSFMIYSCAVHVALATAVLNLNTSSQTASETVQIAILSAPNEPVTTEPSNKATENQAPQISESPQQTTEETNRQPPVSTQSQPSPYKSAPPKTLPAARKAPVQGSASEILTEEESPVVIPVVQQQTVEETPTEPTPELNEQDLAEDFEQIDQQQAEIAKSTKAAALSEALQNETEAEIKDQEEKLAAIKKQNELEDQALAQENAQNRARERAALDAAVAAKKQGELAVTPNQGQGGAGTSSLGENVRSIEELRQLPGNQKPQYDTDDRLRGRQGEVAFLAYVSKEGALTGFRLLKSTGHRELDGKTLKAIKSWKFYPGQEGWVEIPYRWNLKGGAQPLGPILRSKKSASYNSQPTSVKNDLQN